jgi:hypothetical protein
MHFRKCCALVVRELVAHHHHSRTQDITFAHIGAYIDALDNKRKLVQCIYVALCGQKAISDRAIKTVTWWLSHPTTLFNVSFFITVLCIIKKICSISLY